MEGLVIRIADVVDDVLEARSTLGEVGGKAAV